MKRAVVLATVAIVANGAWPANAAEIPAPVAAKLVPGSDGLERLWSGDAARMPVIVRFTQPDVAAAENFASPAEADSALISANRAAQDAILNDLYGGPPGVSAAASSAEAVLKRMDFSPLFAINATAAEVERLAANPNVLAIQEDRANEPDLNQSLPLIGMPQAYAAGGTGETFHVAVLDTGARRTHEFLASRVVWAVCFSTTNSGQQSTSICPGGASTATGLGSADDCDSATIDGCGHGTHTAGIAAGFNTNLQSDEPFNGVARNGRLITINVFSQFAPAECTTPLANGCVRAYDSDIIRGLDWAYALRFAYKIASVNVSIGGGSFSAACDGSAIKPMIDQLRQANIATVISAGNDSLNAAVGSPACVSSAITVASSTKADVRSGFSNWGPLIDMVAPGSSIQSSIVSGASTTAYGSKNGTSMAAPHVAGAWAALRSRVPNATVDQIEAALETTGLGITSNGLSRPRIRVANALATLGVNVTPPPNDNFANATTVFTVPASLNGSNVNATVETGEPSAGVQNGGTTVWWRFTPSLAGTYVVNTDGSGFDTALQIYSGASVNALTELATDNDGGEGAASRVRFSATAGTTYRIRVRGVGGLQGSIKLKVFGPSPLNDDFIGRIPVPGFNTMLGSNRGASYETGEPATQGNSVWWKYAATTSGPIRINTFGSAFDTVLQVSTGAIVYNLTVIGTNDDAAGGLQSELVFNASAGTTYNISVRGNNLARGDIRLTVAPGGAAAGNLVASINPVARAALGGTTVTAYGTMINAGTAQATGCRPAVPANTPAAFSFRTWNAQTGALGPLDGAVNMPAGARQDFLLSFTPDPVPNLSPPVVTNIAMIFDCTNTNPAPSYNLVNTFVLTALRGNAPADLIATVATASNDGIMNIPLNGTGFAGIAVKNIGAAASIQLSLGPLNQPPPLPVTMTVCQTNPATAACLAPPAAPPLNVSLAANQTMTFSVFLKSNGTPIPFDPAQTRLVLQFRQNGITLVGMTSVAVRSP